MEHSLLMMLLIPTGITLLMFQMMEDVFVGGLDGDKFIGYVRPISDDAFMLSEAEYDIWDLHIYKNGKVIGSREVGLYKIVFDVKNKRIYFNENDYYNRDISNPEYSVIH